MRRIPLLILALFIIHFCTAQTILNRIEKSGELRVGTSGTQPPFSMESTTGELMGYEIEIATRLAQEMGVKLTTVRIPFAELLPALEKGKVDIVFSNVTITTDRNMKIAFKGPHMISGKSILTKEITLRTVTNPQEINNSAIKIAVLQNSTSEIYAREKTPVAKITPVANYDLALEMIKTGEVDLLLADYAICAYSVLLNPNEGFYTLGSPLSIEPVGVAMPAGDPLFLNLVENYIMNLELSGYLKQLQDKWFTSGDWLDQVKK
ncbi:MAG: transporter substrate-binding domain-containing protein [Cyclobacteriaceae bacterium]